MNLDRALPKCDIALPIRQSRKVHDYRRPEIFVLPQQDNLEKIRWPAAGEPLGDALPLVCARQDHVSLCTDHDAVETPSPTSFGRFPRWDG
jgi:hypothetical protein